MLLQYPPLLIQQGDRLGTYFEFEQPRLAEICSVTPGTPATIKTSTRHCLEVGDKVLIRHLIDGCIENPGCNVVTEVISDTEFQTDNFNSTATTTTSGGYIARPVDLTGFYLEGCIATKNPNSPSPAGLRATVVQGSSEIILYGPSDITYGDTVTIPDAGISNAKVTNVFESCSSSSNSNVRVITIDSGTVASSTQENVTITRTGQSLLELEFSIKDPTCGQVDVVIPGEKLTEICLPNGHCDEFFLIGCYQIALCQGYDPAPNITECDSCSFTITLMVGEVYMRQTLC